MTEREMGGPTPQVERWVFGGSRVGERGKRMHCWVDATGNNRIFAASGRFAVGSVYEAKVVHSDDGHVTLYGTPRYTGDRADDELCDQLAAQHRAAEVALDLSARERADKRDNPVDQAVERLCELAAHIPASQRTGFAVYVTTRLMRAWK